MNKSPFPYLDPIPGNLESFLLSDATAADCMQLAELDGFLTAIAIGPELIMPSCWFLEIWGSREPTFASQEQAQEILEAIMSLYNAILRDLREDPEEYYPLFEMIEGKPYVNSWVFGFIEGMSLCSQAWQPLFRSKRFLPYLLPILVHMVDENGEALIEGQQEELQGIEGADLIAASVIAINEFWQQSRPYYQGKTKVGRNDLCFCNSGQKFKKCCGF